MLPPGTGLDRRTRTGRTKARLAGRPWVTTGSRAWLGAVPTIQAETQTGPTRPVRAGHWTYLISSWSPATESRTPARLTDFVRVVLAGELVAHRVTRAARDDWSAQPGWSWVWATPKDIAEEVAYVERQEREAREAEEARRRAGPEDGPAPGRSAGKYRDFNEFEILARILPAGAWMPQA
ncbi:hypothetical protein ACFVQ4_34215 [Streptomyces laurentii]|uniref:hypothetical protein n=1 Tax=Streptomyces laurentii TaxID=39478 RepID=UPI00369164BC